MNGTANVIGRDSTTNLEPPSSTAFPHIRLPRYLISALTILGFVVPVVMYFWLIDRYALNVVYSDQWHDIALLGQADSGHLSFGLLWTQFNENRVLFPNLIVLLLGYTTHFNVVGEEYLSGVMLVIANGFFIWTHKRRAPPLQ